MCLNPKIAFQSTPGEKLKFLPRETFALIIFYTPYGVKSVPLSESGFKTSFPDGVVEVPNGRVILRDQFIKVPCANCIECKLSYARQWASRCVVEAAQYADNWFLTLTYDDQHVHTLRSFNSEGEDRLMLTLRADDMSSFMKDLREYFRAHFGHIGIRFFGAGEYGDKTFRPHMHMCIFNLPIPQDKLTLYSRSPRGEPYFVSDMINQIWKRGQVLLGALTPSSAAYTARYCMKKIDGLKSFKDMFGVEDEFVRMSLRPGIGDAWFRDHMHDLFKYDYVTVSTTTGAFKVMPTSAWKVKYKELYPDRYLSWRERVADKMYFNFEMELAQQDLSEVDYMEVKAEQIVARKKFLKERVQI